MKKGKEKVHEKEKVDNNQQIKKTLSGPLNRFNSLKHLNMCNITKHFEKLKVHSCRFENLPTCSCSHKNKTLKISFSES